MNPVGETPYILWLRSVAFLALWRLGGWLCARPASPSASVPPAHGASYPCGRRDSGITEEGYVEPFCWSTAGLGCARVWGSSLSLVLVNMQYLYMVFTGVGRPPLCGGLAGVSAHAWRRPVRRHPPAWGHVPMWPTRLWDFGRGLCGAAFRVDHGGFGLPST